MIKFKWTRYKEKPGYWLQFDIDSFHTGYDNDIAEITAWCKDANCGKRMAYDMFQFKNEADMTTFLLRWA
jgi:hypothetical protein